MFPSKVGMRILREKRTFKPSLNVTSPSLEIFQVSLNAIFMKFHAVCIPHHST